MTIEDYITWHKEHYGFDPKSFLIERFKAQQFDEIEARGMPQSKETVKKRKKKSI